VLRQRRARRAGRHPAQRPRQPAEARGDEEVVVAAETGGRRGDALFVLDADRPEATEGLPRPPPAAAAIAGETLRAAAAAARD